MFTKYFIIGSNSFSGSNFINFLLSKKNTKVFGVSRSKEINNVFLPYKNNKNHKNFNFKKIDLNKDTLKLFNIIIKFKPNYIINFSAQGMVAESWNSPIDWFNTNLISQVKLYHKIKDLKFIKKYIHFTTPEVYGSNKKLIRENFNFKPSTPYATSRAACDLHLKTIFEAYKFPVIFTRTANVYGPGQQIYRIIPKTIILAKQKKKLPLHGGGKSNRSFIHIDDVSRALYLICKNGKTGKTYHISTNKFVSILELVKKIILKMKKSKELIENTKDRLGKDHSYKLSTFLIKNEINWKPKISLDEGLHSTIDWIEKNYRILKNYKTEYIHKK